MAVFRRRFTAPGGGRRDGWHAPTADERVARYFGGPASSGQNSGDQSSPEDEILKNRLISFVVADVPVSPNHRIFYTSRQPFRVRRRGSPTHRPLQERGRIINAESIIAGVCTWRVYDDFANSKVKLNICDCCFLLSSEQMGCNASHFFASACVRDYKIRNSGKINADL